MFQLPKQLSYDDKITVTGTLRGGKKQFAINLVTGNTSVDWSNIACRIEAIFPQAPNYEDKISVKVIKDGREVFSEDAENYLATELFEDDFFSISIHMRRGNVADIYMQSLSVFECPMEHDLSDIRFVTINDDIEKVSKLEFEFAN